MNKQPKLSLNANIERTAKGSESDHQICNSTKDSNDSFKNSTLSLGPFDDTISGLKTTLSLNRLTAIDSSLEILRKSKVRCGIYSVPAVSREIYDHFLFRTRMAQSTFETATIFRIDGYVFRNVPQPVSTMGTQASVPCQQLGWCRPYVINSEWMDWELCPRHAAHQQLLDGDFANPFPLYNHNIAVAVLENKTYKDFDCAGKWPEPSQLPRPKICKDLLVTLCETGRAGFIPEGIQFKAFPCYFEASKFYELIAAMLRKIHANRPNNFCAVMLSVLFQGVLIGSEALLMMFDALLSSNYASEISIIGVRVCESLDLTISNLMINGLQCVRGQHFPLWAFKRNIWDLTENYNPTPGLPWQAFARSLAERWNAYSMRITHIPLAGGMIRCDQHSLIRHITISACLDMLDALVTNPTALPNWERTFTEQYARKMRGGGGRRWIKKDKPVNDSNFSIIDGVRFPIAKPYINISGHKNRCGAYAAYMIINNVVNAGRFPSDEQGLDQQYEFCQELAQFAGFEIESDMLSTESVLSLLMAFGIRATIYKAEEIDGKPFFVPVITSNYTKTFYDREKQPNVRSILFTGNDSCGHYSVLTPESYPFMKKLSDQNTVRFNGHINVTLPMVTGPILKEWNPKLKKLVVSNRCTLPKTALFSNKFVEIAFRAFADVDLAHVFSCAQVGDKVVRVLPRDLFVGSDSAYPREWKDDDTKLHQSFSENIKTVTNSSKPFQTVSTQYAEDGFSSIHIKNLTPVPKETLKRMDEFLEPRSTLNVPSLAPPTANVPSEKAKMRNVPPPPSPKRPRSNSLPINKSEQLAQTPKGSESCHQTPSASPAPSHSAKPVIPAKPANLMEFFLKPSLPPKPANIQQLLRPSIPPKPKTDVLPEVEELEFIGTEVFLPKPITPFFEETEKETQATEPEFCEPEVEILSLKDISPLPVFASKEQIDKRNGVIFNITPIADEVPLHSLFNSFRKKENRVQYKNVIDYYDYPLFGEKQVFSTDRRIISYRNDRNLEHSQPSTTTIHCIGRKNEKNLKQKKQTLDNYAEAISICTKPTVKNVAQKAALAVAFPVSVPVYLGLQLIRGVWQYSYEDDLLSSFERRSRRVHFDNAVVENIPAWVDFTGKSDAQASTIINARVKVTCPFVNSRASVACGLDETNLLEGTQLFAQTHYHARRLVANQNISTLRNALEREASGAVVHIQ